MNQRDLFLLDSAWLSLAPGVVLEPTGLKNSYSGEVCTLNGLGTDIARQLGMGATFNALIRTVERTYDIAESDLRRDLQQFITVLASAQLLSIRQSYLGEVAVRFQLGLRRLLRLPIRQGHRGRRSPYRRYQATPLGIVAATLKAHQPTGAIAGFLAVAIQPLVFQPLIRRGSLPSPAMAFSAAQPLMVYTGLLVASIIFHELMHYWVARRLGVPLKSVYAGPGRVGITQIDVDSMTNGLVSVAGPASTVLALVWLAMLVPQLHLGYPFAGIAAPVLCLAVAIVHLLGLTPLTSDGKQFWKSLGFAGRRPEKVA